MFDFLKKPGHNHSSPQKKVELYIPQSSKLFQQQKELKGFKVIPKFLEQEIQKHKSKKPARVKKYQESSQIRLSEQVQKELKDLLFEARDSIQNIKASEMIKKEMGVRQQTAFIRYTSQNQQEYLQQLFQKTIMDDYNLKFGLDNLISGTIDSISNDIEHNMYDSQVFKKKMKTKQEIHETEQLGQINLIKMKEGQISSKVGELKMELHFVQDPQIISKAKSIVQKQTYSKDSSKIKEIQKFIQSKKHQREQIQRKRKQDIEKQKIRQLQQKIAHQKQLEKAKSQRHAKLVQKLEAKQILKQKRKQQMESQKQKFAAFLKQYKNAKPLFQRKMQEQIQREIEQRKFRFQKMHERKQRYNPLSFSDLQDFEQKYLQLKREQEEKKKIERMIKKDEQKYRIEQMKDKHYKGKFRYLVLEQMVNNQAKNKEEEFMKKLLLEKKRAYSVDIKEKFKPKIDQNKRLEIESFVSKTGRKTKQIGTRRVRLNSSDNYDLNTISYEVEQVKQEKDPKKEGQRNRKLFKQYIQEKIRKGEIKRPETFESRVSTFTPKIDYLREQRQNRETINSQFIIHQSLDATSRIKKIKSQAKGDIGLFKLQAEKLDQKTRRQELKLKYSQHSPLDEKELQENYLASIQAKLQILTNVK